MPASLLHLDGVCVDQTDVPIRHVSLTIPADTSMALLGPGQSGKSGLLEALFGIIQPSAGEVRVTGRLLRPPTPEKCLKSGMAYCPQTPRNYPDLTAEQHLSLGAAQWPASVYDVRRAAAIGVFPELSSIMHRPMEAFSAAQASMLSIARALMSRPSILMLDEPCNFLPVPLVRDLITQLREAGVQVLVAERLPAVVCDLVDHAAIMLNGEIVLQGRSIDIQVDHRTQMSCWGELSTREDFDNAEAPEQQVAS